MSEIQEILLKAQASEAGQMDCPQSVFAQLAGKSDEEILTLLRENSQWLCWLCVNNIATAYKLAEYRLINIADNATGEINAGVWYVPKNVKVTVNGGTYSYPEDGAIIIDNRNGK